MDSTKRALKYKLKDTGNSIMMFWIIIILLDIGSIFLNIKYGNGNTFYLGFTNVISDETRYSLFGVNMLPILIFLIVNSYENYYEDFSTMLNFSITRKTIFKTNLASNIASAAIFSLIQSVLFKLDPFAVELINRKHLYDFGLFNIRDDSLIFIFGILFISFLLFISLWQLIASLNYKFGMKIWAVFLAIIIIGNNIILNSFSLFDLILPGDWLNTKIDFSRLIVYLISISIIQVCIYIVNKSTDLKKSIL